MIERCLNSVKPFISRWVISDTGSTDGTPEIIEKALQGIPGELSTDSWVDFSHNRNVALSRALNTADYILLIDADMVLNVNEAEGGHFDLRTLKDDAYLIPTTGPLDYSVIRLVSTRHRWEYTGVVHEVIRSGTNAPAEFLRGVSITHHEDGSARSDKFDREIRVLAEALEKEPNNPRTVFYLAQSYRCGDKPHQAMELYQRRIEMAGWEEETWYSMYQLGRLQEALIEDFRVAFFTYLQAFQVRPSRLEPILPIAHFYNQHKQYHLAYQFARLCTETGYPPDLLFIERPVYEYLLPIEYAICCHHTGRVEESRRVVEILFRQKLAPQELLDKLAAAISSPQIRES